MSIPTRDELIERVDLELNGDPSSAEIADFALAEIRRAVAEELHAVRMEAQTLREANASWDYTCKRLMGWIQWRQAWTGGNEPRDLSGTRWDICALRGDAPPRGFIGCTPPPGAATVAEPRTDRAKTCDGAAGSTPAPGEADFVWTTKGGDKMRLCEMTDSHLANALAMLRRKGFVGTEEFLCMLSSPPQGDMAHMAWENELSSARPTRAVDFLQEELAERSKAK